ncbi:hypothetical protein niasHT_000614 [Heterodera trifolii]|uniref:Aquaporin n=1 Tax=Heterodera trifolii TaxID=157864 RepID=A0ABD2HUZ2_9BILA
MPMNSLNMGKEVAKRWMASNNRRMAPFSLSPVDRMRQSVFRVRSRLAVNLLSEGLATFLLLLVGNGIGAQHILGGGKLNNYMQVCFGWGMLIALLVFATYHTSGGHLNPAVSLAFVSLGKLPFAHFLLYSLVQTVGAFFGSALCFHLYRESFEKFDAGIRTVGGPSGTGAIFCSFPDEHIGHYTAFVDEIVGTALLLFFVNALIDPRNQVPKWVHPIGFGLAIFLITSSFGMNVGSPINPARDFGPRLFLLFAGYGWEAIAWHSYYFWIPIIAPFVGALFGTWLYQFIIGLHVPDDDAALSVPTKAGEKANDFEFNPLNGPSD